MDNNKVNMETSKREDEPGVQAKSSETLSQTSSKASFAEIVIRKRWILISILLLVAGAVVALMFMARKPGSQAGRPVPAPSFDATGSPAAIVGTKAQPGEIVIQLSPEEIESAGIEIEAAVAQAGAIALAAGGLRTTGMVQANQYKEVPVMPISGGIVKEVAVKLGDKVRRDQRLALIFSTELSQAQGEYLKMQAEIEEQRLRHDRMVELVEIGAASREELEQATSAYKRAQAVVAPIRHRLAQLGMSMKEIDSIGSPGAVSSMISVSAPSSGTLISRSVNPGEVIEMSKEMFRIADLSSVWVIAQVYENDLAQARIGAPARITIGAYPGRTFGGRVSYIDPVIEPQSRTAQARIEVANPGEALKLGMFVDINFGEASQAAASGGPVVVVPRVSIQSIAARQVVYVSTDQAGTFVQREVVTGLETNGLVPVYSGVIAGERVVTKGSFLLRAESLKLNPQQSSAPPQVTAPPAPAALSPQRTESPAAPEQPETKIQTAQVALTADGFQPSTIKLKRGVPARIIFVRRVEVTCATEVLIPSLNVKQELPLNEPVIVEILPEKTGEIAFNCPMKMIRGKILVR